MTARNIATLALLVGTMLPAQASAAGLYFSERGVRPLARGGAFTAGANDLGAIWYNPAGIYDAGSSFLFDASWLNFTTDYTRRANLVQRDPNTGQVVAEFEQTFVTVEGESPVVPIPTLAGSFKVHDDWVIALGLEAPYSAITSYPEEVGGAPAPSRYSLITLEGSALGIVGAWVAYAPNDMWRFGIGMNALIGRFVATTMFGSCVPDRFFCAQEQPDFDSLAQIDVGPIFAPSGNVGVQFIPHPQWQAGMAFQAPMVIRAPATLKVQLPTSPAFQTARVQGQDASVGFELPWSLRWGLQYEPIEQLFVEVDGSWEGWSIHDSIDIAPQGVALANVAGFPNPTVMPAQSIPRNFQDSLSIRLGGEYGLDVTDELTVWFRGGLSYESSAIPDEYLSVLTVDVNKLTTGLGLGVAVEAWRFDLVYAHVFGQDVDVDPADAAIPLLAPLEANVPEPHTVNGGLYSARANVFGLGLRYDFDEGPAAEHDDETDEDN